MGSKHVLSAEQAAAIEYLAHELMRKCDSYAIAVHFFAGTAAGSPRPMPVTRSVTR